MKKILFFTHVSTLGGAGLCLYHLVLAVKKKAVPVVVLMQEGPLATLLREQDIKVYIEPRICPLMSNTNSTALWRNPVAFAGLLHMRRSIRLAQQYCSKESPDVVHLNTTVLMHLAKGARSAGVNKIILHMREHWNVSKWDPRGWVGNTIVKKYVDRIIAISQTAAERFGFLEKTDVVYDWPDFSGRDGKIDPLREWGVGPDKKILLVPGGRTSIKGSVVAMRAMSQVKDANAVMLVLGGRSDTNPKKELIRKVLRMLHQETYGLMLDRLENESNGRIIMLPPVKQILSLIQQSEIIISPFIVPHFSMPSVEGGLLGKPVILSDDGHARETVVDQKTGFIIPAGDVEVLAASINDLLAHPEKAAAFGKAGFSHVSSLADKKRNGSSLVELLIS
ncbi:MAG: glycosyltransferase family 4 protein [Pontiella sp.]